MFEDRKRLFVDLLGWDLSVQDARWEIDQFDDDDAVYLIALDQTGDHAGSLRLPPSNKPHILSEPFPDLRPDGVPTGPTPSEVTRLCLPVRHGATERLRLSNPLVEAMVATRPTTVLHRLPSLVETPLPHQP